MRRTTKYASAMTVGLVIFWIGCSAAPPSPPATQAQFSTTDVAAGRKLRAETPASEPAEVGLTEFSSSLPDRYLIKNAKITVEVDDARSAAERVTEAVTAAKGYVSDVREQQTPLGKMTTNMQIRVPATQFPATLQEIAALGKVLDKEITAQDVTEEYVDTESRLRNMTATEGRLLEHLARSAKLEDTLRAESEVTRVREQIEVLNGRLRFLSHRVDFSTIQIVLTETPKAQAVVPPWTFSSGEVLSDAARSLVGFSRVLWTLAIWIAVWSPVWGSLFVLSWLMRLRKRRRTATPKPTTLSPPPIPSDRKE